MQIDIQRAFAGCLTNDLSPSGWALRLLGLPSDSQSSYRRGSAAAPGVIRASYSADCYNSTTEEGLDLAGRVEDWGDASAQESWSATALEFQSRARDLFERTGVPFFLGGDHAVTIPVVGALASVFQHVHVVQMDAHPDLYPEFGGDHQSHACTGARILDHAAVVSLSQVGVRTFNTIQREYGRLHHERLRVLEARQLWERIPWPEQITPDSKIFVTLDMDVFDPAHAPGVAHPVPGGLRPRQVIDFIQRLPGRLIGMDVVEVNPELDQNSRTAILAARVLHEAMGVAFRQRYQDQ